ncbi:alpha-L-rhamnosidase-related protein [Mucilaginibacter sp. KACC 22063]|uniref:alpha-L-rhamnosidase-related protein n=1 Tax=Mucilaginibacter sp. KACC 22063 TaxID=3025666 RepID=UPI0023653AD2|nr:alpha-L-rhamnosidase C-terminal domain-containing protein [Mucilaginibacter sp. KACC 22063]WDF54235.1 alpha-L-rhamnosidase C-terminal domain-containing protein [Mucilaginibacter sp. KACC 22063]
MDPVEAGQTCLDKDAPQNLSDREASMRGFLVVMLPLIIILFFAYSPVLLAQPVVGPAHWISATEDNVDKPNSWIAFRKDVVLTTQPASLTAVIAADTKYWLWINGRLVVFEGGLKRGPNPRDTYFDQVELGPYLKKGNNKIAVLLWHFGKSGFSHVNSGRAGLLFAASSNAVHIYSDKSWICRLHPAYGTADKPDPNYRLAESNILFDARKDIPGWQTTSLNNLNGFMAAKEIGHPGDAPWNQLVKRPIPQWKDFGIKQVSFKRIKGKSVDTIVAKLPYNMQMTPVISVSDTEGGRLIHINTDHSKAGGTDNLRAEYITKKGDQEYESYGWLNGEHMLLTLPSDMEVKAFKYHETGYDAEATGTFNCSDEFYNLFWKKARRTLYLNMRDNYFDCPDRERAQWWGDAVLLMGESFYTYSTSTHALMRKAISELVDWQRPSGVLFSPIPGNFNTELPDQMLTSIGDYGFWNYYMNTGDRQLIAKVYPSVKKYLALWKTDETGLTELRKGDWLWGDWGDDKDLRLILAGWHYLALDAASKMADLNGFTEDAANYRKIMQQVKSGFNQCWNGHAYRHPSYNGATDDRAQALAVLTGIADTSKYAELFNTFQKEFHASPYMEKYVMEALFVMGKGSYALERTKLRFAEMVNNPDYTTLFEGWGIGEHGFGGGTTNHAWSGGAQIVIAQNLFGIKPLQAGYKTFLIEPNPATFKSGSIRIPTVKGMVSAAFQNDSKGFKLGITVPAGSKAIVKLPVGAKVLLNGKSMNSVWDRQADPTNKSRFTSLILTPGNYKIERSLALE